MAKTDSTEGVRNQIAATKAAQAAIGDKNPEPVKVLEQHRANLERSDREYNAMVQGLPKK